MRQFLRKAQKPVGSRCFEAVREGRRGFARAVAQMAQTSQSVILSRWHLAIDHGAHVGLEGIAHWVDGLNSANGSAGFGTATGFPSGASRNRTKPASTRCISPR